MRRPAPALRRTASVAPVAHPKRWIAMILAVMLVIAGAIVFSTTRATAAAEPSTIWGAAAPSGAVLDSDRAAVELGTTFTPKVDGDATAVRFYKVAGVTGKHTGTIWSSSGAKLATVDFTSETASGWQTARLADPVRLKAGQTYVVSYSVPAGGKYATTLRFSGKSKNAHLAVPGKNSGVYTYDKGRAKPASSWRSSQYWADVTFAADPNSNGTKPPVTETPKPTRTPTATPTRTPTPTPTPTPAPTIPPVTAPTTPPPPVVEPSVPPVVTPAGGFPTRASAGLPDGWVPKSRTTGDLWLRTPGQVVEDLQITNGTIYIAAPNVTLRRIQAIGSNVVNGAGSTCEANLLVEDSEFTANGRTTDATLPVIQFGGYTVRNIMIDGVPEGLRVGGSDINCGPVAVYDSFIRVTSPTVCVDWHGDGIQGYGGEKITVRNSTILMDVVGDCYGTAPFFYPSSQGNDSVDIDGLLVGGGGYPFRSGMPGPVKNLKVIDGSWVYGPLDVNCPAVSDWSAQVVKLDAAGQPSTVRSVRCTGQGN